MNINRDFIFNNGEKVIVYLIIFCGYIFCIIKNEKFFQQNILILLISYENYLFYIFDYFYGWEMLFYNGLIYIYGMSIYFGIFMILYIIYMLFFKSNLYKYFCLFLVYLLVCYE